MKAKFVRKHQEAENIFSFWFEPERPISHIAGQYIEMTLDHPNPDERGIRHWFTISSSPTDAPLVSVTTKFAERSSTFKAALRQLSPGDNVNISDPMGDFVLPMDATIPLVFVAGGIGITPYHSIIKWLIDTHQERDITFIYSVRSEHEMVFQDLFEKYGMKRVLVVSDPDSNWTGETGQLTGKRIIELAQPKAEALIYVSGPEPMVEALHGQLAEAGVAKNRLVGDFFPGYLSV